MEYQNNDSEYFQKSSEKEVPEYFSYSCYDRSEKHKELRDNTRRTKRRIKSMALILASSITVLAFKRYTTHFVFANSEFQNQISTNIEDETVKYEIPKESNPSNAEQDVVMLSDEEKEYILNLKSLLDSENYDGALSLIGNSQTFRAICDKGVMWNFDEPRYTVMIPDMEVVQDGSGVGFYFTYNKSNDESLYYGELLNGLASGEGIKFERFDSGAQVHYKYHKGAFSNGKANGFGKSYTFDTVQEAGRSLEGDFLENWANGLILMEYEKDNSIYEILFKDGYVELDGRGELSEDGDKYLIGALDGHHTVGMIIEKRKSAFIE
jgi:hypothetical protein